ncbi:hypothetical protein JOC25_003572 [Solibacillus kalamii]|uniref:Clp protease ClpB n=1 Tax=Solibacillus kalamii TaxID=1748298 RepID=A0ABX3ZFA5_9BACL|nr:Clp protease ClpB [Solibacillus kalamii]MBM7667045.1 hypothetical protein [Solibacillus kalamii]OUZ38193.1 Clp protease ClpB [Solibacillus kalamii]
MKQSTYLMGAVLLGLSVVISAFILSNSTNIPNSDIDSQNVSSSIPDLMTITQLADYLQISEQSIEIIISNDASLREGLSSYDTYQFIPYVLLDNQKRFMKTEIDAWLKYRNDNRLNY